MKVLIYNFCFSLISSVIEKIPRMINNIDVYTLPVYLFTKFSKIGHPRN